MIFQTFRDLLQSGEHLCKLLLSLSQLTFPEKSTRNRAMIESIICGKLIFQGHEIK